ncbi:MAG: hypothetical protein U5L03_05850 [Burkholderiaceae bacterium]|nr:hypothetical protein [Burkholderiaceae bacterium]
MTAASSTAKGHRAGEFDRVRELFEDVGGVREGGSGRLRRVAKILDELMSLRFTAKMVEKLCDSLRAQVEEVRSIEKQNLDHGGQMRHAAPAGFLEHSPASRPTRWVSREADGGHPYSEVLTRNLPAVHELQGGGVGVPKRGGLPMKVLREVYKRWPPARPARKAERKMVKGNLRLVIRSPR